MPMQKCKNCGTKFRYNDLLKSFFSTTKELPCRNCGALHERRIISSVILNLFLVVPALVLIWSEPARIFIRSSKFFLLLLAILLYSAIVILLSLFVTPYKLKDKNQGHK